eukprot:Skav221203  [mRNA]  locus=scaffold2467:49110:49676:- [translate_table: standard]
MRQSTFADWPFVGPRSVRDYLKAILAGPGDIVSYHNLWVRSSGIAANSAVSHEHRSLCEALRLGLSVDQYDLSNSAAFEHLTRRLIVLEMATARSPQSPDFAGLELVTEAPVSAQGQAQVASMTAWVTEKLKERAQIQKQARLFREEQAKKGKKPETEDDEANPSKRWRKKKNKAKDSGGAQGSAGAS